MTRSSLEWLLAVALFACPIADAQTPAATEPADKIDPDQARALADARFLTVARALGSKATAAPVPDLDHDGDDLVFVYVDPTSAKRITIFVPPTGPLSARVQGP